MAVTKYTFYPLEWEMFEEIVIGLKRLHKTFQNNSKLVCYGLFVFPFGDMFGKKRHQADLQILGCGDLGQGLGWAR